MRFLFFGRIFFTNLLFIIVNHREDGLVVLRISVFSIYGNLLFSSLANIFIYLLPLVLLYIKIDNYV